MAAAGGAPPVGPFPAGIDSPAAQEDYDKLRRRVLWSLPYGLYVLGSRADLDGEPRRNLMTINWVTQVSFDPKVVAVGIEHTAFTHQLVQAGRVFSLGTVDREDRAIVRKFTKPVEIDAAAMTANGFAFHDAPSGAPVLDQSPAWLDCAVMDQVEVGNHTLFLGEVGACGFQRDEDTPVLRMEDTRMNYGG